MCHFDKFQHASSYEVSNLFSEVNTSKIPELNLLYFYTTLLINDLVGLTTTFHFRDSKARTLGSCNQVIPNQNQVHGHPRII
jgi:hypothetical protein